MTKTFHFVRHHEVPDWERIGWIKHDSLNDTHHGFWSTLMEWRGEGEPVKPFFISHETVFRRVTETQTENADGRTATGS